MSTQEHPTRQFGSPLLNLPSELVESVIVFATLQECHTAASALAQTCRSMRMLVYGAVDQHLWRELFLAVFDDPRIPFKVDRTDPSRQYRTNAEDSSDSCEQPHLEECYEAERGFDWGTEFRTRVWARRYVQGRTSLKSYGKSTAASQVEAASLRKDIKAFEIIVSAVDTALPSPPTVIISMLPDDIVDTADDMPPGLSLNPHYPVFPPPHSSVIRKDSTTTYSSFAQSTTCSSVSGSVVLGHHASANIRWLEELVAGGLPADLIKKLCGAELYGGIQGVWHTQEEATQIRTFCKLLSCTGFVPIPTDEVTEGQEGNPTPRAQSMSEPAEVNMDNGICMVDDYLDSTHSTAVPNGDLDTPNPGASNTRDPPAHGAVPMGDRGRPSIAELLDVGMSELETESEKEPDVPMSLQYQQKHARRMARMRVYNLRYLHPDRHWGPYLLPPDLDCSTNEPSSENFLQPILALFADHDAGHPHHHHHDHDDDDDDDDDDEDEDEEGIEDEADGQGHEGFIFEMPPLPASNGRSPLSLNKLYPDWTYLAAVRMVVEANLREAVNDKDISGLVWLDSLRRDSAPRAVKREGEPDEYSFSGTLMCDNDNAEGWDWAGVTGSWR